MTKSSRRQTARKAARPTLRDDDDDDFMDAPLVHGNKKLRNAVKACKGSKKTKCYKSVFSGVDLSTKKGNKDGGSAADDPDAGIHAIRRGRKLILKFLDNQNIRHGRYKLLPKAEFHQLSFLNAKSALKNRYIREEDFLTDRRDAMYQRYSKPSLADYNTKTFGADFNKFCNSHRIDRSDFDKPHPFDSNDSLLNYYCARMYKFHGCKFLTIDCFLLSLFNDTGSKINIFLLLSVQIQACTKSVQGCNEPWTIFANRWSCC